LVKSASSRPGRTKGSIRKSNRTDNESAKLATSKGVIQGYTGVDVPRSMRSGSSSVLFTTSRNSHTTDTLRKTREEHLL
jgi:hypothetical protein